MGNGKVKQWFSENPQKLRGSSSLRGERTMNGNVFSVEVMVP